MLTQEKTESTNTRETILRKSNNIGTDAGKRFHRLCSHRTDHSLPPWQEHHLRVKSSPCSAALGLFTEQLWHDVRFKDQVNIVFCVHYWLLTQVLPSALSCAWTHVGSSFLLAALSLWQLFLLSSPLT